MILTFLLNQVPPIIINILHNKELCSKYDLSHVTGLFTGAAPLGAETAEELLQQYPKWIIRQGYGEFILGRNQLSIISILGNTC